MSDPKPVAPATSASRSSRAPSEHAEIVHLTTLEAWQRNAADAYQAPSLAAEGFIHCSTPAQVVETAYRHYRDRDDLVLLRLDPAKLTSPVVYEETSGHGTFPHIYGPIDRAAVTEVVPYATPGRREGRRLGVQWGMATIARVKLDPLATRRSRCGVWM